MLVAGQEMSCVQVAAHTLQVQLLLVLLVVEVRCHGIVRDIFREKVGVAALA